MLSRSLTPYDHIEPRKSYKFSGAHSREKFASRNKSMAEMAKIVGRKTFHVVKTIDQQNKEIYIQYQIENDETIRGAYIDSLSVGFLDRICVDFKIGQAYRVDRNHEVIRTLFGPQFWEHVGTKNFRILSVHPIFSSVFGNQSSVEIINWEGCVKNFRMRHNDADFFTEIEEDLKIESSDNVDIVKTIELKPITSEKERLAAIKLLESIRYE